MYGRPVDSGVYSMVSTPRFLGTSTLLDVHPQIGNVALQQQRDDNWPVISESA
ncbi:hypothetical protein DAPPUDRAFT_235985 [Daphnia pulex]|uniref:Uncharacterized protein n=1 Tax=Daphnia pulex TaxID=6669 RepID=E9FZM2_DAPPU|nr:hypothetical protein DAPPUDRAFT_235985 [Daphnia pulex]|eukprot:EFX87081.1 hypothetical protein DAPPUDRAFT_235985 [Daphnia pulex]